MTDTMISGSYGEVIEPATLKIERLLPGPVDRVWDYLTKSDLRRQWLASGDMARKTGADFELTWRNDELTDPPGKRPEGFSEEHSAVCKLLEYDPPHILSYTFGKHGEVTFTLTPTPAGTHLRMEQVGFRPEQKQAFGGAMAGWRQFRAKLEEVVAREG